MSQSEVPDRIRQVAIVLTSVDAVTARKLLAQLPADQARLVRQRMINLGIVQGEERQAAMKSFMELSRKSPSSMRQESAVAATSPAEAILQHAGAQIDQMELSMQFTPSAKAGELDSLAVGDDFRPASASPADPFHRSWHHGWRDWSGEELARLLRGERPNVIAALILQSPTDLATSLLQSLETATASAVLAALPQLHTTDPSILQEIYELLHQRLVDFQRQSSPANAGMTKLKSILKQLDAEQRTRIDQSLAASHPMLAHALGLHPNTSPAEPVAIPLAPASAPATAEESPDSRRLPSPAPPRQAGWRPDFPVVDLPAKLSTVQPRAADEDSQGMLALPELDFESLVAWELADLAIVLRSLDPITILKAASGASRQMRQRIEALIDPSQVNRLRTKLHRLRKIPVSEKQQAQQKIALAAQQLQLQGHLVELAKTPTMTAA
jgi:flagellar motor switch protein FliG